MKKLFIVLLLLLNSNVCSASEWTKLSTYGDVIYYYDSIKEVTVDYNTYYKFRIKHEYIKPKEFPYRITAILISSNDNAWRKTLDAYYTISNTIARQNSDDLQWKRENDSELYYQRKMILNRAKEGK